jgi:3-dehydroquinate dehydratase-2
MRDLADFGEVCYNVNMSKKLYLLHGPNLNLLGSREPQIYGSDTLGSIERAVKAIVEVNDMVVVHIQSNQEGELIDAIHAAYQTYADVCGVIINPGAFTHYSYALRDALALLKQVGVPVVEVHISNPSAREEFRHTSVVSGVVTGTIAGLGSSGYQLAAQFLVAHATALPTPTAFAAPAAILAAPAQPSNTSEQGIHTDG